LNDRRPLGIGGRGNGVILAHFSIVEIMGVADEASDRLSNLRLKKVPADKCKYLSYKKLFFQVISIH
jgi:hypothetical protein